MTKALVLTAFFAAALSVQAADSSPAELRIAYNVLHDREKDDYEIFAMNPDGSDKKNISNWKGVDWVYYANGSKLYFVSDRDTTHRKYFLYEMNWDGTGVRKISKFLVRDSWIACRNGCTEFVVGSSKDGKPELYLIDKDGNELRRLTSDTLYDNDPIFSPDGKQIVFRSRRGDAEFDELWMMDDTGGNLRRLTTFPSGDSSNPHAYHAGPPFWEPNKNVISFLSVRNDKNRIYTINPDGTGLAQIKIDGPVEQGWHTWSPDGRWLTFDGTDAEGNYDIYLLDTETNVLQRLTDDPLYEQAPVFVEVR